jgi:hypothetical protein
MNGSGCHLQLFAETPASAVRWRLLSGNNREIARGMDSYPDAESCRIAIKELQASIHELQPAVRQTDAHRWVWQLADSAGVVVASAHQFDRLIRCQRGLEQARTELPLADIGPAVMFSLARRWGGAIA